MLKPTLVLGHDYERSLRVCLSCDAKITVQCSRRSSQKAIQEVVEIMHTYLRHLHRFHLAAKGCNGLCHPVCDFNFCRQPDRNLSSHSAAYAFHTNTVTDREGLGPVGS